jgi:hypothetical protein
VVCDDSAMAASALGMFRLAMLAWRCESRSSCRGAYFAVEKRKKGDVLRNASAEGSAARASAPKDVLTMMA